MARMTLNVFACNAIACRLYDGMGFAVAERKPAAFPWSGENLHMVLNL
jgi:ribosomal protein S18 acetylase RimI-like enzyme